MVSNLYALVFALVPVLYVRQLPVPFEGAKVNLIYVFTLVLLIAVSNHKFAGWVMLLKRYKYVGAFLFVALFSSFVNQSFSKSFWGNYFRFDGLYTLFNFAVFALLTTALAKNLNFNIVAKGVVLGVFLAIVLSFFVSGSTFGNVNLLAGYLAVTLPIVVYTLPKSSKYFYLAVLAILALYFSSKALIVGMVVYVLFQRVYKLDTKYLSKAFVLLLVLVGVFYVVYVFSGPDAALLAESRERITRRLLYAFSLKPVFGWGWANIDIAVRSAVWPIKVYKDVYLDKAHGVLLETLLTTGLVGLLVHINILRDLFMELVVSRKNEIHFVLFSTLFLFVVHSQLNVISIAEELVFWFVAGLLLANFQKLQREK